MSTHRSNVQCTCEVCGKSFLKYHWIEGRRTFCSVGCYRKTRQPRTLTKTCDVCGEAFTFFVRRAVSSGSGRFCSSQCMKNASLVVDADWIKIRCEILASGCWNWDRATSSNGRGNTTFDGNQISAPRLSWQVFHGSIPARLLVLHSCDNPLCVNPDHLFVGTHKDNMQDMIRKGRKKNIKLCENIVQEIRSRYAAEKIKIARLAEQYGVSACAISNIVSGKSWSHVV